MTILLIDDEETQRVSLKRFLSKRGYEVFTAAGGPEGYAVAEQKTVDLVITDFRMPGWDGLEVLRRLKALNPDIEVIILTAFGNLEDAVTLMKEGAYDYLSKPVDLDELEAMIRRVHEKCRLIRENQELKTQLAERYRFDSIISGSSAMEEALNYAGRVAPSKTTVLIRGESGTGKELVARAIHQASPLRDEPFEVMHIAAFNEELVESELFGHEKGAFTGANEKRIGRLERANGGTLFFDEVGDIPMSVQVKLLRMIQFGEFQRVGGNETIEVDVRLIAATHRNLEEMIREGTFREDLFYRLNVVTVWLPPLRKRKTDIPPLVDHFIARYAKRNAKEVRGITREALDRLMKYDFPGNVRELENLIERAVVLARDEYLTREDLPAHLDPADKPTTFDPTDLEGGYESKLQAFESAMIEEALRQSEGNKSAAARILGITERHLRYRLEKLGIG
ncbi:MAG: sigma-54 dependent transcriptional regulator [Candidatus Latescibacterota bacterium]